MVVTNLSDNSVTTSTLDEVAGKIAKALAAGHLPSVVQHKQLREMVFEFLPKKD